MKIYWTTMGEISRLSPEIFSFNLKADGMFIGAPGTLIFRTREEAQAAIEKAKAAISQLEREKQEKRNQGFDEVFGGENGV